MFREKCILAVFWPLRIINQYPFVLSWRGQTMGFVFPCKPSFLALLLSNVNYETNAKFRRKSTAPHNKTPYFFCFFFPLFQRAAMPIPTSWLPAEAALLFFSFFCPAKSHFCSLGQALLSSANPWLFQTLSFFQQVSSQFTGWYLCNWKAYS